MYGLKQEPRLWYDKIDSFFLQHGYKRSKNDPYLYTVFDKEGRIVLISLYVDDLIIIGNVGNLIKEIKEQMSQVFEMKDLGELHYCLDLEVWRDSGQTFLSQSFLDFDWAGNVDDKRSITSYAFSIGSGVITWSNKNQNTISLSSVEAEYQAMCATICEAVWLRRLLLDAGKEQKVATMIKCDNQCSIKLANNLVFQKNKKHIDT
eukprot:PITA_29530